MTGILSPKRDLNSKAALINDGYIPSVFDSATLLNIYLSNGPNGVDNTNGVYSSHLLELVDLIDGCEAEPKAHDTLIFTRWFDLRVLIKDYRIIVLNAGVLCVSHVYFAVGEKVNFVFL